MQLTRLKAPTMFLAVVALVVGVGGGAVGAKLITGADIKDGTIGTQDLKKQAVTTPKLAKGSVNSDKLAADSVTSGKIKDGAVGPNKLSQSAKDSLKATFAGPNWSIVDRNVQGGGASYLRAGPIVTLAGGNISTPPLGVGSLGIRTDGPDDKSAFGNQVDFVGTPFSSVTAVSYWLFTTGEDLAGGVTNTPSPSFEVDFNPGAALDFHTVFYQPSIGVGDVNRWRKFDAVADTTAHWGVSGVPGTLCDQNGGLCTFDQLQQFFADTAPNATILTVQITKGSGQAPFSGAVDALQINNDVFDFEPLGVTATTP
jgi:hypothetical protein